jgi:hypothetical protein
VGILQNKINNFFPFNIRFYLHMKRKYIIIDKNESHFKTDDNSFPTRVLGYADVLGSQ